MSQSNPQNARRQFLQMLRHTGLLAGAAIAGGAIAGGASRQGETSAPVVPATDKQHGEGDGRGYHDSAHIRKYYASTRIF